MSQRTAAPQIPIQEKDLLRHLKNANVLVSAVSWKRVKPVQTEGRSGAMGGSYLSSASEPQEEEKRLGDILGAITPGDSILSDAQHYILLTVRKALQVGFHLSSVFQKESGMESIGNPRLLADAQLAEYNEKMRTASAVALFTASRYAVWALSQYKSVEAVSAGADHVEVMTCFDQPIPAFKCMVFSLAENLSHQSVTTDAAAMQTTLSYFETLVDEVKAREESFKFLGMFSGNSYKLEETDFTIQGFEVIGLHHTVTELREVYPHEIIGNTTALIEVQDTLSKLFLYDPVSRINPILELGGFQSVMLLEGDPGNGKTEMGAVARTLGRDLAEATGLPYLDVEIPNMVSKMQGESTDMANAIIRKLRDPRFITLAVGDEWEVVMPDHGGDDESEGDKKVAVAWLKGLSGVGSVDRGDFLLLNMTNYSGKIDRAYMSRIKSRHRINGAETIDDYIRFIVLKLRKFNKLYPGLVNLKNVDWDLDTRAPQIPNKEKITVSPMATVQEIYEQALAAHDKDDIRFFAQFLWMMKERQSRFSLRDCANTVDGVKAQVANFKIPKELIENEGAYRTLEIDKKRGVLLDIAMGHVRESGLNFVDLLAEKAIYYAEGSLRMVEEARMRAVDEMVEHELRKHMASQQLKSSLT